MLEVARKKYLNLAFLILRFAGGGILAYEGALKLFVVDQTTLANYFGGFGFPAPELVAIFITYFEFLGGLLIVFGIGTRLLSFLAAGEMVVAAVVANLSTGITAATEVDFLLFAIFFTLFLIGGGKFSAMRLIGIAAFPLALFAAFSVFAAGGGGGGGGGGGSGAPPPPPPCEQDTWTCTSWSICSVLGNQTRTCSLADNCPTVETPKPPESQSCPPPAVIEPPPVVSESKPKEPKAPVESCTKDDYKCGDWNQCQPDGRQYRSCNLSKDCPGVSTKKPEESRICPGLRCGQLETLRDRISCRLGLTQKELAQEFAVLYAPEYCKVEETKEKRNTCTRFYQEIGPCWKLPIGRFRTQCAKNIVEKSGTRKEQVKNLTIFRLYELEVQAETLMTDRGAPKDEVVELETFIETKKQEIEKTDDTKEWKKIIREIKPRWQKFINDVKPFLNATNKQ